MPIIWLIDNSLKFIRILKMKNLFRVGTLISLSAIISTSVYATNLHEVIEQAVLTNPSILEKYNQKISREYEVKVAHGDYLPEIEFDAGAGFTRDENEVNENSFKSWDASIGLKQMLFDGFFTSSEKARQKKRVESAYFELYNLAEEVAVGTVEAYVNVLLFQHFVDFAKANLESHEKMFDQIEMRSILGADDQSSLIQMKGRLKLAFSNVEAETNNLQDRWTEYLEIVGSMPKDRLEDVDFNLTLPESYKETLDYALANHPALSRSKADIEQFKLQKKTSKSFYYPRVDLELKSTWNNKYDSDLAKSNQQTAFIRFNYNFYNGGADKARAGKDQFLRQEADEHLEFQRRRVEKDVAFAWNTYKSSERRLVYLSDYVKSTEDTSKAFLEQFQIGERTLLDLLNTENEIFEARKEYLQVKYQNILAKYRVLTSMGVMLEKNKIRMISDEYYQADDINEEVVNNMTEKNIEHNERELEKVYSSDTYTDMRYLKMNTNLRLLDKDRRETRPEMEFFKNNNSNNNNNSNSQMKSVDNERKEGADNV
jgi:outer membrane protein, adhesin transport system